MSGLTFSLHGVTHRKIATLTESVSEPSRDEVVASVDSILQYGHTDAEVNIGRSENDTTNRTIRGFRVSKQKTQKSRGCSGRLTGRGQLWIHWGDQTDKALELLEGFFIIEEGESQSRGNMIINERVVTW